MNRLVLRSQRVLVGGALRPAAIVVLDGQIADVETEVPAHAGDEVRDYGDAVIFPGIIDAHVHMNDPGRADWEGFETATRAAAAGGITTVADMPLNSSPVTTTAAAVRAKKAAAQGRIHVDVALYGGLVAGGADKLIELLEHGVAGVKAFMVHSGIDDFPASHETDLREAMQLLAPTGLPLLVHAELDGPLRSPEPSRSHRDWLTSRPPEMETEAIALLGILASETGARVHVVHVSSLQGVALLEHLRWRGIAISGETCPHYLTFASDEIPDGATEYKCAPPIRDADHRDALWQALQQGVLSLIASDHSPSPPEMKQRDTGDFFSAWGGIASLQFLLPAVWTVARERGISIERLAEWLCEGPAELLGLERTKGSIAPGMDADFCIWNPDEEWEVTEDRILHRHKLTPYLGRMLRGTAVATYLRGHRVASQGQPEGDPRGNVLSRALQRRPQW